MRMRLIKLLTLIAVALVALTACGGSQPVTLAAVPNFESAKELKPGEDPRADTLAENMKQAGSMGANLEQKIFSVPQDTGWDSVKGFYDGKLREGGWEATNLPVAMPANDMVQMQIYRRGNQTLTVMLLTEPVSTDKYILYSLSSV
jgi:hypothetical protein